MEAGDISNFLGFTIAWDFRLFINIKYPQIFSFLLKRRLYRIAKYFYSWEDEMLQSFYISNANGKVLVTHLSLHKIFRDKGLDVIHLASSRELNALKVDRIYTPDTLWVTTCAKCEYLQKPPEKIHNKRTVDFILAMVDKFLIDKG